MTGKQVVDEWTAIKRMVVQKQQLMMMPFKRLWARMLSMFSAQYPLILLCRPGLRSRTKVSTVAGSCHLRRRPAEVTLEGG